MIGMRSLPSFSPLGKSMLLVEAFPRCQKMTRLFHCQNVVVRQEHVLLRKSHHPSNNSTPATQWMISRCLLTGPSSSSSSSLCLGTRLRRSYYFSSSLKNNNNNSKRKMTTNASNEKPNETTEKPTETTTWLQRFLAPKEIPPRGTFGWYREMVLICTVFAITGSSTMMLVRPAVSDILGLKGSFKDGPWSYRISSIVIMTPLYGCLLIIVGTLFGRHAYFRYFSVKIFSRFGIPPELMDKSFHETKQTFRKW